MLKTTDSNGKMSSDLYRSINLALLGTIDCGFVRRIEAGMDGNNLKFWYYLKSQPIDGDGFGDICDLIAFYIRNDFQALDEIEFKIAVVPQGKCSLEVLFNDRLNGSETAFYAEYDQQDYRPLHSV